MVIMPDRFEPTPPPDEGAAEKPLGVRLAWFVGLAVVSGGVVAVVAYVLRGVLFL